MTLSSLPSCPAPYIAPSFFNLCLLQTPVLFDLPSIFWRLILHIPTQAHQLLDERLTEARENIRTKNIVSILTSRLNCVSLEVSQMKSLQEVTASLHLNYLDPFFNLPGMCVQARLLALCGLRHSELFLESHVGHQP